MKNETSPRPGLSSEAEFSVRISSGNPDHHLWWNRGTWWFHGTVHNPNNTKQRLRTGLKTKDVTLARMKRDAILSGRTEVGRL
jgi:hypothetical protein